VKTQATQGYQDARRSGGVNLITMSSFTAKKLDFESFNVCQKIIWQYLAISGRIWKNNKDRTVNGRSQ
jgi:hypothetical protein